jgi:cytochrome c553
MLSNRFLPSGIAVLAASWIFTAGADEGAGWYTREQAAKGHLQYAAKCGVCHGADLKGGGAPELKGPGFAAKWNGKSLEELYTYSRQQMPKGNGDSLPPQDYADIVAYMLSQNGIPSGSITLAADGPMKRVLVLSDAASASAAQAAPAEPVKLGELAGPVKQPKTNKPTQSELDAADGSTSDWLMYNKGYRGERYSRLSQLNHQTASRLRPVCVAQLGDPWSMTACSMPPRILARTRSTRPAAASFGLISTLPLDRR